MRFFLIRDEISKTPLIEMMSLQKFLFIAVFIFFLLRLLFCFAVHFVEKQPNGKSVRFSSAKIFEEKQHPFTFIVNDQFRFVYRINSTERAARAERAGNGIRFEMVENVSFEYVFR